MSTVKSTPPAIPGLTYRQPLGGGGFADVFLYIQHSTKATIAVKVLRAEHLGSASLDQFRNEAEVMARVSTHPYIVTVLDAGVADDGRPYLAMEYYPQPHFGLRARRGALGVAEVLRVAIQVASAVETAHRAGIVHRDIKPANILTSEYGNPGLTDFGVAGVQGEDGLSVAGGVSPGFTAPEVLLDDRATGSRASDVYALGATVYALLAGRSPLWHPGGDNSEGTLTHRAATGEVGPIGRDDVPRTLEHAVRQCLQPDPALRPDSAATFARMLQDVEQALSLSPTPLALVGAPTTPATTTTAATAVPAAPTAADDADATRRKARVVDPHATAPPAASPSGASGMPSAAAPNPAPAAPSGPTVGGIDTAPTVARGTAAVEVDPVPTDATPRRRWLISAIAAAATVLVIAGVALATGTGTSRHEATTTTTTLARTSVADPFVGRMVGLPTAGTAVRAADGSVTIRWQPPAKPADVSTDAFTYDVYSADDDTPLAEGTSEATLTVPATEAGTGRFCADVYAVLGDSISTEAARVCTAGDGEAGGS